MNPKFSVILTSYNRPTLVSWAIASVRQQTLQDWELWVMDDDSNEETLAAICAAEGSDPRIHVVLQAGGRPTPEERKAVTRYCITINEALKRATGDYIAYLCDDDNLYPRSLEVRGRYLDEHPDAHVVYGRLRSVTHDAAVLWDSSGKPRPIKTFPEYGETDPETGKPVNPATWEPGFTSPFGGRLDHNMLAHRRCCLEEMGGPPWWPVLDARKDVGDSAFFRRFDAMGHVAFSIPDMVVTKNYHAGSMGRAEGDVRE